MTRHPATLRQIDAANPAASTWVAANAGSGKTRVLTDRVARLLLSKVDAQNILCLTYTKAAASEMQNRLFRRLGSWAMLPEAALRQELADLGDGGAQDAEALAEARRLFARAIETPGGLRIQTIHSFCAGILRRFPLEAGVSPQFTEMEDRAAALLRIEVADAMAVERPDLVAGLATLLSGDDIEGVLRAICERRDLLAEEPSTEALCAALALDPALTPEALLARVFGPGDRKALDDLAGICARGSAKDVDAAEKLAALPQDLTCQDLPVLEGLFLFGGTAKSPFGAKIGTFPTKATRALDPGLIDTIDALMQRVADARQDRLALQVRARTEVLTAFAAEFLHRYEARKLARGLLDFDDLIARTRALLTDQRVAQWVLFRLDGGIDHILVDESQDTSPAQWAVIRELAEEFGAGIGARPDRERTIFVVGDKKQSIYSFQGADPEEFDRMQAHFDAMLRAGGKQLLSYTLEHSFRSAEEILRAVDHTFGPGRETGLGAPPAHLAFKEALPGRVDLWPPEPKGEAEERVWFAPVDAPSAADPDVILADRIAREIVRMKAEETIPVEVRQTGTFTRRPVTEGDVLILVQRRSALFAHIIRACKAQGLAVAGSDRLKLGAELAVKDIVAVLRFVSLAEDDLALAEALKSPLFGWTEAQLHDLAAGRGRAYLWQRLRQRDGDPTLAVLDDLRGQADYLRPFDLINRLLLRHDGRRRLLARLGPEAEDGIDQLLQQALAYEATGVPSLTGFLEWVLTEEVEVKRQIDTASNQIRVMTVHGAKGLEAPIVFLPDSAKRSVRSDGTIFALDGLPVWGGLVAEMPDSLLATRAVLKEAELRERRRLLYVAMTRAECWLIACAAGDVGEGEDSWHGMIADGLAEGPGVPHDFPTGEGLRVSRADWDRLPLGAAPAPPSPLAAAPEFGPVVAPRPASLLSPSDLGGAKVMPDEGNADGSEAGLERSLAQGRIVHALLEHLPAAPPEDRDELARRLLEGLPDALMLPEAEALIAEVVALIDRPDLAPLFGPGTLAEAPVTGPGPGGRRIAGTVDRLIVTDTTIRVVDFKSNRIVPSRPEDVPEGLLRQMGAYDHVLRQVWPDREIETAILWTVAGTLMVLPQHLVTQAFARATAALTHPGAVPSFDP